MKEKKEAVQGSLSELLGVVAKLTNEATQLEEAKTQAKTELATLERDTARLAAIKAEYLQVHGELVADSDKLNTVRAALAKLKDLSL